MSSPNSFIAGNATRSLAYLADLAAIGFIFLCVNALAETVGIHVANSVCFAFIVFAYHGYFLWMKDGVSYGKYLRNIVVYNAKGGKLNWQQSLLRAALIALPYAGISGDSVIPNAAMGYSPGIIAIAAALAVAWFFADLMLLEYTIAPRTLTDRVAKTIVVNLPPPQPHRAPAGPMYSATDAEFGSTPQKT